MQHRYRSRVRGSLVMAAISLLLAACGGNGGTTGEGASGTPATTEPTGQADPLEGEWRAEFTCKESLRAIESHLSSKQIREQVGSLESFMQRGGTKDDPCHGETGTREVLVRFSDGNLGLIDVGAGEGVQATYELVDDHTIIVNDPSDNLCPCPGTWEFEITGDQVTFHVEPDIYIIETWESAPFHRVS